MKYGVQMYAIRTLCKDDLEAGIRAASEIGYEGLEFAGFFGHSAEAVSYTHLISACTFSDERSYHFSGTSFARFAMFATSVCPMRTV